MLTNGGQIPDEWRSIQHAVSEFAPGGYAVLAGGALRDLDYGVPFKDIDIFVPADDVKGMLPMLTGLSITHDIEWTQTFIGYMVKGHASEIAACFTAQWNGLEVQIIGLLFPADDNFPYETVNRIDMGFCQIGWDGEKLMKTGHYAKDKHDGTMTTVYAPTPEALARSRKRAVRLQQKYPDRPHLELTFDYEFTRLL